MEVTCYQPGAILGPGDRVVMGNVTGIPQASTLEPEVLGL